MRLTPTAFAIAAACAVAPVWAASIVSSHSTPSSAQLPPNGGISVQHVFDIKYLNNETTACAARLSFSDGTPSENLTLQKPQDKVSKFRQYQSAGNYKATLEGYPHSGLPACLGSQTTTATVQSATPVVQDLGVNLAKAKLSGMTLAQTTLAPANPTAVVFNLQADKPVANCQLTYELKTNYTAPDMINLTVVGPLDYGSPTGGWSLPIQSQQIAFGTLLFNGQPRLGPMRFILRAKNLPNNTCSGEAHADFEIKSTVGPVLSPAAVAALESTSITGVAIAPNWYDFLKKQYTLSIKGKGKQQCAYLVEFKNETLGKVVSTFNNESVLPMDLLSMSADLPAGNYTIAVKPGKVSNPGNPNIHPCTGFASIGTKVVPPADAMRISSTLMKVTKTNNAVLMQPNVTLPMAELKAIHVDVNFSNSMNLDHNTPNSCAYKIATHFPQGGYAEAYYYGQGVADKGVALASVSNQGIYNKGPGQYTIRIEGTTSVPGNSQVTPCLGAFEHKLTLQAP